MPAHFDLKRLLNGVPSEQNGKMSKTASTNSTARNQIKTEDRNNYRLPEQLHKDLKPLLELLIKSQLNSLQRVRVLEGILMDTIIFSKSNPAVQAAKEALQDDNKLLRLEQGGELGSPMLWIYPIFVKALVTQEVGRNNRETLEEHIAALEVMDTRDDLFDIINHFLVKDCFQQDQVKISFVCPDEEIRQALVSSMKQLGGTHKKSKAPRGNLEDELFKWLSAVQMM